MTAELKDHIIGSIKRIGAGAYCEAFKIYYDTELCDNLRLDGTNNGLLSQCNVTLDLAKSPIPNKDNQDTPLAIVDNITDNIPSTVDTGIESQCPGTGVPLNSRPPWVGLEFSMNGNWVVT